MHHEVLLVLSGYPGNTFAVSRESGLYEVCIDRNGEVNACYYGEH